MSTTRTSAPRRSDIRRRVPTWRVPLALVALSLIPVVAGSVRLADLSTGSTHMPQDAHHPDTPVALVVHIVSATAFSLLGAFQFSAGLRRRHARWHRAAGRVLVPTGLVVALSALWLTLVYPTEAGTGPVLLLVAPAVRARDDGVPRPGIPHRSRPEVPVPSRLDDPRLRARARRRHPGRHHRRRGGDARHQHRRDRRRHRCRMGGQPRRRRSHRPVAASAAVGPHAGEDVMTYLAPEHHPAPASTRPCPHVTRHARSQEEPDDHR